jgi:hypothetical protein
MAARPSTSSRLLDVDRQLHEWFEPRLRKIGLGADQIAEQDLPQLKTSLEKVNDAIAHPDSFGKFSVTFSTNGPVVVARTDGHIELGILPLLLERKGQILERIAALQPEQKLSELREDIATTIEDSAARDQLIETIDRRFEEQRAMREDLDREQALLQKASAEAREKELWQQIKILERKAAVYQSFLERESVASVVGAILLLILGIAVIVAMFVHVSAPDVVSNAFLLILGYFFGTAVIREKKDRSNPDSESGRGDLFLRTLPDGAWKLAARPQLVGTPMGVLVRRDGCSRAYGTAVPR